MSDTTQIDPSRQAEVELELERKLATAELAHAKRMLEQAHAKFEEAQRELDRAYATWAAARDNEREAYRPR